MNQLILHPSSLAQWYTLVCDAQTVLGKQLHIDLESYLVHLLQYYTNKPEILGGILALEYLNSLEASGQLRIEKLREVGDKCLLFSGFFPEIASKRNVTVSYFVQLGRCAYDYLALAHPNGLLVSELYGLLCDHYIHLVDLLFTIRALSGEQEALTLIQAEELWRNAGSEYAYKLIKKHNGKAILQNHAADDIH